MTSVGILWTGYNRRTEVSLEFRVQDRLHSVARTFWPAVFECPKSYEASSISSTSFNERWVVFLLYVEINHTIAKLFMYNTTCVLRPLCSFIGVQFSCFPIGYTSPAEKYADLLDILDPSERATWKFLQLRLKVGSKIKSSCNTILIF